MDKPFFCYSYPLKEYFVKNGLKYITAAINQSTGKRYWLFEGSIKLDKLLKEWRANRQSLFYYGKITMEKLNI